MIGDVKKSILEALCQARLSVAAGGHRFTATWIVTEAYFPAATTLAFQGPDIAREAAGLPRPSILSYYDVEYLLAKVSPAEIEAYLDWRAKALGSKVLVAMDELDVVRTYLQRDRFPLERMAERRIRLVFTGHDPEFASAQLAAADRDLGLRNAAS